MKISERLVLSARQAAEIIGCAPGHVRWMAKRGIIKATKEDSDNNQHKFEWLITRKEAERIRDEPPEILGRPRGGKNQTE